MATPWAGSAAVAVAALGSTVKLFVKKTTVSYSSPWKKASQSASTGTGFLITERYIVTNAHVVQHATSILARAQTSPVKVSARVVALAIPADLALLEVENDFWTGKQPLAIIEELPELDENVTAIGFPAGGDQVGGFCLMKIKRKF